MAEHPMTPPSHHYLVALWDEAGRVTAGLAVARGLVERGHRVTVLADPPIAEDARAIGAAFRAWDRAPARATRERGDDPVADWDARPPFGWIRRLRERLVIDPADRFAADVAEALDDLAPDVVVADVLLLGAHVAAEAAAVPCAALVPTIYPLPAAGSPPFGTGWQAPRTPPARLCCALVDRLAVRLWDRGLPRLNQLRATRGLEALGTVWAQLDRLDRVLVLSSRSFDAPARVPENVRYVGPQLDDPSWAAGPWEPPPGDEPLVLVSLSSGPEDQLPALRRVVAALGSLPVRGLVTTGRAVDPAAVPAPASVRVVRSAPHSVVLDQAAAVVTHGGHGTVVKALAAGVPVVCLPMGRDQRDNAARVTRTGAGLRVPPGAKAATIAEAVRAVVDDRAFRIAARDLWRRLHHGVTDPPRVVQQLEAVVEERRLRSP
ncbi:MAG: nucleotide disphospho-sugar-binding domain-containing protein [Egibacteraceae bacterium]